MFTWYTDKFEQLNTRIQVLVISKLKFMTLNSSKAASKKKLFSSQLAFSSVMEFLETNIGTSLSYWLLSFPLFVTTNRRYGENQNYQNKIFFNKKILKNRTSKQREKKKNFFFLYWFPGYFVPCITIFMNHITHSCG